MACWRGEGWGVIWWVECGLLERGKVGIGCGVWWRVVAWGVAWWHGVAWGVA